MATEITVVDYDAGNLFSVARALEHCGATVTLSGDPDVVRQSSKILLPGVGAFGDGMAALARRGLDTAVKEAVARGNLLLGVCLGMQFLLDGSEEFGEHTGLGLVPGQVVQIPVTRRDGAPQKIPHIGWNELAFPEGRGSWTGTPLQGLPSGAAMYFVHSFMAAPLQPAHVTAECVYGGHRITAVVGHDNVWGAQFHPEKSGTDGLRFLKSFVNLP
ncbi:MAG TPA: imidazole glycerol phosphate synthase subunit HisH [Noviherbaspirillum sp.]|jgi:glutamine amidotransferase|uniref:imidazole glycerol phosphate synthase subunit HisH n=1 Tax=Noviherbaspirillum sp. TaxID=1926288 RepID=UPI002F930924